MPNRVIKETIHTSETVNRMTDFQFRLWVSLITYVDDFGRGDARAAVIKGACFPLRERVTVKDIDAALRDLAGIGCVGLYEVDGKPYLYFPTWESHQSIRNQRSKYPAPEDGKQIESNCMQLKSIENNCNQLNANVPVIQSESNPNPNPNPKDARAGAFVPPTLEEVAAFCMERGSRVDPKEFFEYFNTPNSAGQTWIDAKGQKVRNWKQKLITWEKYETPGRGGVKAKGEKQLYETSQDAEADTEKLQRMLDRLQGNGK